MRAGVIYELKVQIFSLDFVKIRSDCLYIHYGFPTLSCAPNCLLLGNLRVKIGED